MVRTGLTLLTGNATTALLLLLRNLAVAALIPVADYGVAATFAMVMSLIEMASTLGLQQQIVQSPKGAEPRFQAAVQGFHALRGVAAAAVLLLLAGPLAAFLGVPEVAWAYQVLAFVPLSQAFLHFDLHRLQREMRFGPMILAGVVPALLSLVLVWPLAAWLGDYRVMLIAVLVQAGVRLVMSHVVAQRRYALVIDLGIMGETLKFGWPLLVNAVLLYIVFQGDKIIVGRVLGMEALALLAMGFTLTLMPTLVLAKSTQNFFLPQLSRGKDLAQVTLQVCLLHGLMLVVGIALLGAPLVRGVLGSDYAGLEPLLLPLAVLHALRVAKAGPGIVALAAGYSSNAMWGNAPRVCSLAVVWLAVMQGQGLLVVIWIACAGEALGLALALVLMHRRVGVAPAWWPYVAWGACLIWVLVPSGGLFWGGVVILALISLALMIDLRRYLRRGREGQHA